MKTIIVTALIIIVVGIVAPVLEFGTALGAGLIKEGQELFVKVFNDPIEWVEPDMDDPVIEVQTRTLDAIPELLAGGRVETFRGANVDGEKTSYSYLGYGEHRRETVTVDVWDAVENGEYMIFAVRNYCSGKNTYSTGRTFIRQCFTANLHSVDGSLDNARISLEFRYVKTKQGAYELHSVQFTGSYRDSSVPRWTSMFDPYQDSAEAVPYLDQRVLGKWGYDFRDSLPATTAQLISKRVRNLNPHL